MSVEDTDFSPPATAVMFLLTIHPTALEAGDFLSTDVKILLPLYRLRPSFSMPKIFRIKFGTPAAIE